MNSRGRERVPTEIAGGGRLAKTGAEFTFSGLDFTAEGMQLQMEGISPTVGLKVVLEFTIGEEGAVEEPRTLSIAGEIMRVIESDGEPTCGVKWSDSDDAETIQALENYYTERFFDMMD